MKTQNLLIAAVVATAAYFLFIKKSTAAPSDDTGMGGGAGGGPIAPVMVVPGQGGTITKEEAKMIRDLRSQNALLKLQAAHPNIKFKISSSADVEGSKPVRQGNSGFSGSGRTGRMAGDFVANGRPNNFMY